MSKSDVFHLGLTKNDLQGATLAIVPGDPDRVEKIAALMDKPVKLASHREFTTWRAELDGKPVIVCSTGIGGPSTSIAVEELAQLGIRTFLRIGTTGAIQPHINVGDVLVTTASVRLDGASLHFAPLEFPAVADFECTTALVEAAKSIGATTHVGVTASSDTFYPGQERYDTYSGRVVRHFKEPFQHTLPAIFCRCGMIARAIISVECMPGVRVHDNLCFRISSPQRLAHGFNALLRNAVILTTI